MTNIYYSINKRTAKSQDLILKAKEEACIRFNKEIFPNLGEKWRKCKYIGINLYNYKENYLSNNIDSIKWLIVDSGRNNANDIFYITDMHPDGIHL